MQTARVAKEKIFLGEVTAIAVDPSHILFKISKVEILIKRLFALPETTPIKTMSSVLERA